MKNLKNVLKLQNVVTTDFNYQMVCLLFSLVLLSCCLGFQFKGLTCCSQQKDTIILETMTLTKPLTLKLTLEEWRHLLDGGKHQLTVCTDNKKKLNPRRTVNMASALIPTGTDWRHSVDFILLA